MSSTPLFDRTTLQEGFSALRHDLIHEEGPRISTMRNYRFAIVQYAPSLPVYPRFCIRMYVVTATTTLRATATQTEPLEVSLRASLALVTADPHRSFSGSRAVSVLTST